MKRHKRNYSYTILTNRPGDGLHGRTATSKDAAIALCHRHGLVISKQPTEEPDGRTWWAYSSLREALRARRSLVGGEPYASITRFELVDGKPVEPKL